MENKGNKNPRACARKYAYVYTCSRPAYAYTGMHTHARVPKTMKDKFSAFEAGIWNESHIVWELFQTLIFFSIKSHTWYLQNIQKILRENLKFTRNSESKREIFTKHPQVNFLLIETFSSLDLRVLKFTNQFGLIVNKFD